MDAAVSIPGTRWRIGLDGLLGLIPVVGDGVAAAIALYIVAEAYRLKAPPLLLLRMLANIALDFLVGLVPVFGDIADVGFRANRRNVELLRRMQLD